MLVSTTKWLWCKPMSWLSMILHSAKGECGIDVVRPQQPSYFLLLIFSDRRNPLRMLSNAIDFRARTKKMMQNHRPKSADFERLSEKQATGWYSNSILKNILPVPPLLHQPT